MKGIVIPGETGQARGSITVSAKTAELFRRVAVAEKRRRDTDSLLLDMITTYVSQVHPDWQVTDDTEGDA